MNKKDNIWYEKIAIETSKHKYPCKCGHKQIIPYQSDYTICGWCGRKITKDKQSHFKDKVRQLMNNNVKGKR